MMLLVPFLFSVPLAKQPSDQLKHTGPSQRNQHSQFQFQGQLPFERPPPQQLQALNQMAYRAAIQSATAMQYFIQFPKKLVELFNQFPQPIQKAALQNVSQAKRLGTVPVPGSNNGRSTGRQIKKTKQNIKRPSPQ
eukprot:NODE_504_length_7539_cov_0.176613.p4 type:complete len:136 gc:universal NODE_504_length_7539_cov_0.176613:5920-6327(+)